MSTLFSKINKLWNSYWYLPSSPEALAALRIISSVFLLTYILLLHDFWFEYFQLPLEFWTPKSFYKYIDPNIISLYSKEIRISLITLLVFSIFGLFTRISLALVLLTLLIYFGYEINFFKPKMYQAIFLFVFGVLSLSRSGDALSIDKVLFKKLKNRAAINSWAYHWPIKLVCCIIAYLYVSAGLLKILRGGTYWITSDNLAFIFIFLNQPIGVLLGKNYPLLCRYLAAAVILLELSWIIYFVKPKITKILLLPSIIFHIGCYITLGLCFFPFAFFNIFFLNWSNFPKIFHFQQLRISPKNDFIPKDSLPSKRHRLVHAGLFLTIFTFFIVETVGNPNKPFNWPFVSYSMFSYPMLDSKTYSFSTVEIRLISDNGVELQLDRNLATPFSPKHLREILDQSYKSNDSDRFERILQTIINRVENKLSFNINFYKSIIGIHIYLAKWSNIKTISFDRNYPDKKDTIKMVQFKKYF